MHVLTLSDHTQSQLEALQKQRKSDDAQAVAKYQQAQNHYHQRLQNRKQRIKTAWQQKGYWRLLGHSLLWLWVALLCRPSAPVASTRSESEAIWSSGNQGEERIEQIWQQHLNDDWTLIRGYLSAKGEIDQIIVGPAGIFACEIKNINGTIYCDGDKWWLDKYDRYGNLVETGKIIADRGGRSPSRQLNEATHCLQAALQQQGNPHTVQRWVILSHERAAIGNLRHLTTNAVLTTKQLSPALFNSNSNSPMTPEEVAHAVSVICQNNRQKQRKQVAEANH